MYFFHLIDLRVISMSAVCCHFRFVMFCACRNVLDITKPILPEVENPTHTCECFELVSETILALSRRRKRSFHLCVDIISGVHGFVVNDRLFPEAMNPDENGKNVCPVCLTVRKEPSKEDPGFVRWETSSNFCFVCLFFLLLLSRVKKKSS